MSDRQSSVLSTASQAIVLVFFAAASFGCGNGRADSAEECRDMGGVAVYGTGPGPSCKSGETEIGAFHAGIEGAICCIRTLIGGR